MIDPAPLIRAFRLGRKDHARGIQVEGNPYEKRCNAHKFWLYGWYEAQRLTPVRG